MTFDEQQTAERFRRPTVGGAIVLSKQNSLGPGKVVSTRGGRTTIEYFYSPGRQERKDVDTSSVLHIPLERQTRCFLYSESRQRWLAGRVTNGERPEYQVDLPDGRSVYVQEEALHVRCHAVADPMETLLVQGHETAFFHLHRIKFLKNLLAQRGAFHGLTALASSRVELYPHQVEIVRRVLEDPIQRYILADEVGLGKTIEAGVLLRQYLIDEPRGRALVIAPPSLTSQWRSELADRFLLDEPEVVVTDIDGLADALGDPVGMLVVDEAHNIGADAFSGDPTARVRYDSVARVAHGVARLLLLSATPAANHEQEFLAMLHLLEPATYKLNDLDAFRVRVEKRQAIGRLLLAMREDSDAFVLKRTAARVSEILPDDETLRLLSHELLSSLSVEDQDRNRELVRQIRAHISESYRIHRRMLRSRRDELGGVLATRAHDTEDVPCVVSTTDLRTREALRWIDDWRAYAAVELDLPAVTQAGYLSPPQRAALELYKLLIDCATTSIPKLERVAQCRLSGDALLTEDISESEIAAITTANKFEGEREILKRIIEVTREPKEGEDQADALCGYLHSLRLNAGTRPLAKCVVFTSDSHTARQLTVRLTDRLDSKCVATIVDGAEDISAQLKRFEHERSCFVLVCDRAGEEGLNLQFADQAVFFNLPWSPNQIEQRIGRLDRIGRTKPVKSVVFRPSGEDDSILDAWLMLLRDELQIFRESVAGLQFFLQQQSSQLDLAMLADGAAGIRAVAVELKSRVAAEKDRLREQSALDEIDASTEHASRFYEQMDSLDAEKDAIREAFEDWACTTLKVSRDRTAHPAVVTYSTDKYTMIPRSVARQLLGPYLQTRTTFDRAVGVQEKAVAILRVGHGLVDGLSQYIDWDDRGSAYAIWRHEPTRPADSLSDWMGFRLHFAVQADLRSHRDALEAAGFAPTSWQALQRRADGLLPPKLSAIEFTLRADEETDAEILRTLRRPFKKREHGGNDTNLHKDRLRILADLVPLDEWEWSCRTVRARAEEALRSRAAFIGRSIAAVAEVDRLEAIARSQLVARASQSASSAPDAGEAIKEHDALFRILRAAVASPSVRLESVGFVVISGRRPFGDGAGP